jgi:hypothetical protein
MLEENRVKQERGKIDNDILIEAIASGKTYVEAGLMAGSKGTSETAIKSRVSQKLATNSNLKKSLVEKLEEKQHQILDSISRDEIKRASLSQKSVSFGIFTEKRQLLQGDPTQRIETMPRFIIDEVEAPIKGVIVEEKPKQIEEGNVA